MWVLGIETSSKIGSVAALAPDGRVTTTSMAVSGRHGDVVVPTVRETLAHAGITLRDVGLLVAGIGPGSFTGVRAALAVVQGLAIATSRPVLGVGSLEAMAASVHDARPADPAYVLAVVDARRGEVFAALIAPDGELAVAPQSGAPNVVASAMASALGDGARVVVTADTDDAALLGPILAALGAHEPRMTPVAPARAEDVARLGAARFARGERHDAATLVPLYVRAADATLPAPPRWSQSVPS